MSTEIELPPVPEMAMPPKENPIKAENPYVKKAVEKKGKKSFLPTKVKKFLTLSLSLIVILILALVITKLSLFPNLNPQDEEGEEVSAPTPNPNEQTELVGPVSRYATHSAVIAIEQKLVESEAAFKEVRFREDAYLMPSVDLSVDL